MRRLYVLVPSLVPTGPIKGAIALCNALAEDFCITLVTLKRPHEFPGYVDSRIKQVKLRGLASWREYRNILSDAGGRMKAISLSFCFSADFVNFLVKNHAVTVASIRGHLPRTYRVDYSLLGKPLSYVHYHLIARLNYTIAMTRRMASEFEEITGRVPFVVGNFLDESELEPLRVRKPPPCPKQALQPIGLRYVFVGRLDPLKNPKQVIEAVCTMLEQGIDCSLEVLGDGPLRGTLSALVSGKGFDRHIRFHGHTLNPWKIAADADCLVLPSITEGVSRAAMEALYLGIPCVMRDVDSNSDLIKPGQNGALFSDDSILCETMKEVALLGRRLSATRSVLLDESFREKTCVSSFRELMQKLR